VAFSIDDMTLELFFQVTLADQEAKDLMNEVRTTDKTA
jgi:hypothetical protein